MVRPDADDAVVAPVLIVRTRLLSLLCATVLVALAVPLAAAAPTPDPAPPADEALNRYAWLSLAGRAAATGGLPFPVSEPGGPPPEPYVSGPGAESPVIVPPPALRSGSGALYAVGDSVLLGAEPYLRTTLTGWDVRLDGRVSRPPGEGFDLIERNMDRTGDVLVVLLGHNCGCGAFASQLESVLERSRDAGVQRVVLVTVAEWSAQQAPVNRVIRDAAARHDHVVIADWQAVSAANPQFLRGDRVHLTRSGAIALANLIAVMVGPAPARDGVVPPRPRLLPIPAGSGGGSSGGSGSGSGSGGQRPATTAPAPSGGGGGTSVAPTSPSTTSAPTTTASPTTAPPPSTTAPSSSTTAAPSTATTAPSDEGGEDASSP